MDPIGTLARLVTSLIPGGEGTEPVRIVVGFLVYASIVALIAFARPIAMHIPALRQRLEKGEGYAGKYVQIIRARELRRYSILEIFYSPKSKEYLLKGWQYDPEGNRAIDFTSVNVAFREGPINYIEFVWQAETVSDKARFDGYTQMRIDDKSNSEMYEGRGFFVTFHETPLRFDLRFFKITNERLDQFKSTDQSINIKSPTTEQDRHAFVVALHSALAKHPSLQPIEESGEPVL